VANSDGRCSRFDSHVSGTHDDMMRTSPKYEAMVKAGDKYGTIGKINRNLTVCPSNLAYFLFYYYNCLRFVCVVFFLDFEIDPLPDFLE
jgi:hypothetical protein